MSYYDPQGNRENIYVIDGIPVYLERQEALWCGKHSTNSLLQRNLFTNNQLMSIAQALHRQEENLRGERITNNPSPYYSIDGNFNVSVIIKALSFCGIQLVQIPTINRQMFNTASAILVNVNNAHWLVLRKIREKWFNLDSTKLPPFVLKVQQLESVIRTLQECNSRFFVTQGDVDKPIDPVQLQVHIECFSNSIFHFVNNTLSNQTTQTPRSTNRLAAASQYLFSMVKEKASALVKKPENKRKSGNHLTKNDKDSNVPNGLDATNKYPCTKTTVSRNEGQSLEEKRKSNAAYQRAWRARQQEQARLVQVQNKDKTIDKDNNVPSGHDATFESPSTKTTAIRNEGQSLEEKRKRKAAYQRDWRVRQQEQARLVQVQNKDKTIDKDNNVPNGLDATFESPPTKTIAFRNEGQSLEEKRKRKAAYQRDWRARQQAKLIQVQNIDKTIPCCEQSTYDLNNDSSVTYLHDQQVEELNNEEICSTFSTANQNEEEVVVGPLNDCEEQLMYRSIPPTSEDLQNYESNATQALLLFHVNSGLASDIGIEDIPTTDNNPDEFDMSVESNNVNSQDVPESCLLLKQELEKRLEQLKKAQGEIYEKCQSVYNASSTLAACGCCGMRAFQFSKTTHNYFGIDDLDLLRYSEEEKVNLLNVDEEARKIVSFYISDEQQLYHLHPEFVEVSEEENRCPTVTVCDECTAFIRKGKKPKFSIAAGVDFGSPSRIGLPEPNIAEQYAFALACPYVTVFKLIGNTSNQRQFGKRGHAITYLHDSPSQFAAQQTLPRVEGVEKVLNVCFVGSRLFFEAFVPSFRIAVPDLVVRPNVVYAWLHYLKQVNPLYKDIEIVDNEAVREALANITTQLINNTVVMDEAVVQTMEQVIEEETASYGNTVNATSSYDNNFQSPTSSDASHEDDVSPITISHCFVNNTNAIQTGHTDPISAIFRSVEKTVIETTDSLASQTIQRNCDETTENVSLPSEDTPSYYTGIADDCSENEDSHFSETETTSQSNRILVNRESRPINEFTNNHELLLKSFPSYFILGKGILSKGTQSPAAIRHMMLQFTNRMAQCHRLIFLLFDQKQKHAVSKIVSAKVISDPDSMKSFGKLIQRPQFLERLREAANSPNSKMAKKLLKEIMPFVEVSNAKVPFTKASRKAALSKLLSFSLYHGMPSIFFTIAPDDIQDPNRIRLSLPQKNNTDFPAEPGEFLSALQNNDHFYAQVPIQRHNLAELLVKSPVAAAEMFNMVVDTINSVFFGIEPNHKVKKTTCLTDRKTGVFGKTSATATSPEEQGRGSLHGHFCLWSKDLSPKLMQAVGGVPGLEKIVSSMIDIMIQGEVRPEVHVEALLRQCTGAKPKQAMFFETHNPTTHPVEFQESVARTINCTGIHTHNGTCRKGKPGLTGCRLGRPQPCRCCTTLTQIIPVKTEKGEVTYKELSFVELRSSIPNNISNSQPLGTPDKRILLWEIKRPLLDVDIAINDNAQPSRFLCFSDSREPLILSNETQSGLNNLEEEKFNRLLRYIKGRNGMVVEHNPLIASIFKCNTNAQILGSHSQAKSLQMYLLKYVTKSPGDLTASLTILKHSRIRMDQYPSQADNAGTFERTAIRYLQGVSNMMVGASEYSAPMAAYAILDYPPEIYTAPFWNVYVTDAINYVHEKNETPVSSNFNNNGTQSVHSQRNVRQEHSYSADAARESLLRHVRSLSPANVPYEDEYCGDDELYNSDQEDIYFNPHPTLSNTEGGPNTKTSSKPYQPVGATVYKSKKGPQVVSQVINYAHRGKCLSHYSLYEYAGIIVIIEKPKQCNSKTAAGRKRNATFQFSKDHPLHDSHVQQIRSKFCVPTPIHKAPKVPPPKPEEQSEIWNRKAEKFANYMLVLFRPWTHRGGQHPGSISWESYCDYIRHLKSNITDLPPFINQ